MPSERRCAVCGGELPTDSRADARYCSGACRQAALRDRAASDAMVVVGGISAPVTAATMTAGAWGTIGEATITCSPLRGEPARDSFGRIPVEVSLAGQRIWAGDLQRIERSHASGAITLKAAGPESSFGCAATHSGAERSLEVRDLSTTVYGSAAAAPVAVAVRGVRDHVVRRIGTGDIGAIATLTTKVQRTFSAVEDFADRLAAKLASEIMLAEAAVTDCTVAPGERVRLEHDAVRDREFTVSCVTHTFRDDALTTTLTALHVPSAPIQLERGGFATIPTIGSLASVQAAWAAPGGGLAA